MASIHHQTRHAAIWSALDVFMRQGVQFGVTIVLARLLAPDRSDPLERGRKFAPLYVFVTVVLIALVTMLKGLTHVGLEISIQNSYLVAGAIALVIAVGGAFFIQRIEPDRKAEKKQ